MPQRSGTPPLVTFALRVPGPPPIAQLVLTADPVDGTLRAIEIQTRPTVASASASEVPTPFRGPAAALLAYLRGEGTLQDVPCRLPDGLPPVHRAALDALAKVPYGARITYGELAARAGHPRAARAVGAAMARNPLPLVLPCHRVVAAQGLGGYGPGLPVKRALLALEARHAARLAARRAASNGPS